MKRREFIAALGSVAAATSPVLAQAQQRLPVIGLLSPASANAWAFRIDPFRKKLKDEGFVEGETVRIEYRWAEDQYDRLPSLADELVRLPVDVLVAAGGAQTALAAKAATSKTPIIFQNGSDPVRLGLVASLARPQGNLTGVTNVTVETVLKRIELVRDLVPSASVIGYLTNPRNPNTSIIANDMETFGRSLGRQLVIIPLADKQDFDRSFASLMQQKVTALVISADPFFFNWRNELVDRIGRAGVPAMYPTREFVEAGGLASYGADFAEIYRQVAIYTARILKGERPSDLPVVQSTKFELVINNKTAKALSLEVPLSMLMRVDRVVE
jgi:putative ABC transport system substrate-binding protein